MDSRVIGFKHRVIDMNNIASWKRMVFAMRNVSRQHSKGEDRIQIHLVKRLCIVAVMLLIACDPSEEIDTSVEADEHDLDSSQNANYDNEDKKLVPPTGSEDEAVAHSLLAVRYGDEIRVPCGGSEWGPDVFSSPTFESYSNNLDQRFGRTIDLCDGVDNDGDGQTDEDFSPYVIYCGVGGCRRSGCRYCNSGSHWDDCTAGFPKSDANCNNKDDDCDGQKDEHYVPKNVTCGEGVCESTGVTSCTNGSETNDCVPLDPPIFNTETICNGTDDDCDGQTDEDFISSWVTCGVGACEYSTMNWCENGSVQDDCVPGTPAPNDASCNHTDDDCDGFKDEDYISDESCFLLGECATSNVGSSCTNGNETACQTGTPTSDDNCDNKDNDCDGLTDEHYVPDDSCFLPGECASGNVASSCAAGGVETQCQIGAISADDSCDNLDNDCDGLTDEHYVPDESCFLPGECASGNVASSCAAGGVETQCQTGEISADDNCDNLDNDCDGLTDEHYVPDESCFLPGECASGNVASSCAAGVETACQTGATSADDNCDDLDNDCDNQTDEHYTPDESCFLPGECASGNVASSCAAGVESACQTGATSADDNCDNLDNDCDNLTDEHYAPDESCFLPGECASGNVASSCAAGVETLCQTGATSADDNCDDLDNDCDNQTDEHYTPDESCFLPGECALGNVASSCAAGVETACQTGATSADDNCDDLDNDCDNLTDEHYTPDESCFLPGECASGNVASSCAAGGVETLCQTGATSADDNCDNLDNDCDSQTDEHYVPDESCFLPGECASGNIASSCAVGGVETLCQTGATSADDNCDNLDNDCDNLTDEHYTPDESCFLPGECASGNIASSCAVGGVETLCQTGATSADDSCDNLDNDCDNLTDEHYTADESCFLPGECASGNVASSCAAGGVETLCQTGATSADDNCDNLDNDCDNQIDEHYVPDESCFLPGECASGNVASSCSNGTETLCQTGTALADNNCDNVDNDCDGETDEHYESDESCFKPGACAASNVGSSCTNGIVTECQTGTPTGDDNCDGDDNDCDGQTDEHFVGESTTCGVGACASTGTSVCIGGSVDDGCEEGPEAPDDSACNGIDDDCDGTTDEDCVIAPVIVTQPVDVSVAEGDSFSLEVTVSGTDPEYQWQRFEADIPGANESTFTKEAVFSDYGAIYRCVVSNSAGSVTSETATVTVLDELAPSLSVDGPDQQVVERDLITVSGHATDTGSGLASVEVSSDRYTGVTFGLVVDASGTFSGQVPLKLGDNLLTVIATDAAANEATHPFTVTSTLTPLPRITITEPMSGSTVAASPVDVSGFVRSNLPADQIRLLLGEELLFPTASGTEGEYEFTFEDVALVSGANTLIVRAETVHGNVTAQTVVTLDDGTGPDLTPPVIELNVAQAQVYLTDDVIPVGGSVVSASPLQAITVNGAAVEFHESNGVATFDTELKFSELGVEMVDVVVQAVAQNGKAAQVTYTAYHDPTAPNIEILLLDPDPVVNSTTETPYVIEGTITETYLAGFVINNQSIGVLPGATADAWTFHVGVPLVRGETTTINVQAWDLAGNVTSRLYNLNLDATLDIEIISPSEGAELTVLGASTDVDITVRIPGIAPTDVVKASLDGAVPITLALTGTVATGSISVDATGAQRELSISVENSGGTHLAGALTYFTVTDATTIPLQVILQEPTNQSTGAEPNSPILFHFNRPVDPTLLEIEVLETVHGMKYDIPRGADILNQSGVKLVPVDRDRETVDGGLSITPGGLMVAFYPDAGFEYGGTIFTEISYNGEEVAHNTFTIRPLPTLVQGFVGDNSMIPLSGITVSLPGLNRTTVTDAEGNFAFGFGEPVEAMLPAGRHRIIFNQGLADPSYGSTEGWLHVQPERLTMLGFTIIPRLDASEPFRHLASGDAAVLLAHGYLELDVSAATVFFPSGASEGDVHAQAVPMQEFSYPSTPAFEPPFAFALQPSGIEVDGPMGIKIHAPPDQNGSFDYFDQMPDRVLLIGLDPEALQLVPIGVGRIDRDGHQIISEGELAIQRLDYIAFTPVHESEQQQLLDYTNGDIGLPELIGLLVNN